MIALEGMAVGFTIAVSLVIVLVMIEYFDES